MLPEQSFELVLEQLRNGDSSSRRRAALELVDRGERQVLPALIDALHDPDVIVGSNATKAIIKIGTKDDVHLLIEQMSQLNEDEDDFVLAGYIGQSLAGIIAGFKQNKGISRIVETCSDFLSSENVLICHSAATFFSVFQKGHSLEILVEQLQHEERPSAKHSIVMAITAYPSKDVAIVLTNLASETSVEALVEAIESDDYITPANARGRVIGILVSCLEKQNNFDLRIVSATMLGKIGTTTELSSLDELLGVKPVSDRLAELFMSTVEAITRINTRILDSSPSIEDAIPTYNDFLMIAGRNFEVGSVEYNLYHKLEPETSTTYIRERVVALRRSIASFAPSDEHKIMGRFVIAWLRGLIIEPFLM